MSDMMPVIYVPSSRYTSATPVVVPVFFRFLRAAFVLGIEWESLRIVEEIPLWAVGISLVLSILILVILESRDWLRFKGKHYFSVSLLLLLVAWGGVMGYGLYLTLTAPPKQLVTAPATPSSDVSEVAQLRTRLAAVDPSAKEESRSNSLRQAISQMGLQARQRLGDALFDFSNALDGYARLWQALNKESGEIRNDAQQNIITTSYESHLQKLADLKTSAKAARDAIQAAIDKWDFYSSEEDYIFDGYNPDNTENAAAEWLNAIPVWAKIENRQDRDIINLVLWYPEIRATDFISAAAKWQHGASERLDKLKALLQ